MKRVQRLIRDEKGMSLVFIGMSLMALLSASMLAIDVGMLMTARNQAQNSADAGALAGATALYYDDYDDRSDTGPAKTNAVNAATANNVMGANVDVTPADVEFINDAAGTQNRVRVKVWRTTARGNPVSTLIAHFFGMSTADISAVATAEASPADAMTCVKPFTIPDRWDEKQTPPWDPTDTFDLFDSKGKELANPDVYIPKTDKTNYTGYNAERDKGELVVLKSDNTSKISPGIYYPWAPEGNSGADDYRRDIAGCNQTIVGFDEILTPEPGFMQGPTVQGMKDLIDKDPSARWDVDDRKVITSMSPSPRVVIIPLFDPYFYEMGKHGGRNASLKAVDYLGFFIEEMRGSEVVGRVTPVSGLRTGQGTAPAGAFPMVIRLVQ
jgi:Flp pilus assembly protein TadG